MSSRRTQFVFLTAVLLTAALRANAQQPQTQQPVQSPAIPTGQFPGVQSTSGGNADTEAHDHLKAAFGADSPALNMPFHCWLPKERIALAFEAGEVKGENRVRVTHLHIAMIKSDPLVAARTLVAPVATLRLDRNLKKVEEIAGSQILSIDADSERQPPPPPVSFSGPAQAETNFGSGGVRRDKFIDPRLNAQVGFKFTLDPQAPIKDFLPSPLKAQAKPAPWTNEDLAKVPELTFGEPIAKTLPKAKAMEATAHVLAKINHLNQRKTDGFLLALLEQRGDLRGLPMLMGDACRTREDQAKLFAVVADSVRQALLQMRSRDPNPIENVEVFFSKLSELNLLVIAPKASGLGKENVDGLHRAAVAAMVQILMPESEVMRTGLARYLATIPHPDATKALANLALYSPEAEVRAAAIDGLKTRRERDYTDVLLQGFRYPLPAVSKRAAEALVRLERKDLLPQFVEVLERSDPRLPMTEKRDGKAVSVVRELVKVNHHRNCVLCHAPANPETTPEGVLKVAVPLPTEALPKPAEGGYRSTQPLSPDIVVRLDMTYLRQDFSVMLRVADAHPWPEMQRFDFLVRTRDLTPAEAASYEPCCEAEEPGKLSPYHRAALFALRELTGLDTEPTAAAWRKLLRLPARS